MKNKKAGQVILITVTVFMILLLLFPAFYALSISMQDEFSIYKAKPKMIPDKGKNICVELDYTDYKGDEELETVLKKDCTVVMFSTYKEQIKEGITAIEVIGKKEGRQIFYARAHTAKLALEKDYGVYKKTNPNQRVLLNEKNYPRFMDKMGYEFKESGLSKTHKIKKNNEDFSELSKKIQKNYTRKYSVEGTMEKISISESILQLLEKYIHYFSLPNYMFSENEKIEKYGIWAFSFNTILTTAWAMVCQMFIPAITAYPLAVLFKKKTANRVLLVFLITMMIPFASIMVPQLILMREMGMYDNYWAMLFPWLLPSPFYILLYKSFFQRIPISLFEAARIDGAGELYTFTRICLPLSKAIISLVAIQAFISGWCDFFWYYMATKNVSYWTLNVAIFNISTSKVIKQNFLMGISIATLIPIIIVAFVFSKQLKSEVISSAVKE